MSMSGVSLLDLLEPTPGPSEEPAEPTLLDLIEAAPRPRALVATGVAAATDEAYQDFIRTNTGPNDFPVVSIRCAESLEVRRGAGLEAGATIDLLLQPKQAECFLSPAQEINYGGAAGGGKSFLMRAVAIFYCVAVPGVQVYLFRRRFADLDRNHRYCAGGFEELLGPLIQRKLVGYNGTEHQYAFRLWGGSKVSRIHLCHLHHLKDLNNYQGAAPHVLLVDEATQFMADMLKYLRGRVRLDSMRKPAGFEYELPRIIYSDNPGGIGHHYMKTQFVTPGLEREGKTWRAAQKEGGMVRAFIPAQVEDNRVLLEEDEGYLDRLEGMGDPALVRAMRRGDWDIQAGTYFEESWFAEGPNGAIRRPALVPGFKLPDSWKIERCMDWGFSKPFSVLWIATADGTAAELPGGHLWAPPRGSLIVWAEWYGCVDGEANVGIKLPVNEAAQGILRREWELGIWYRVEPGPADGIWGGTNPDPGGELLHKKFERAVSPVKNDTRDGVWFRKPIKSPGTIVQGLQQMSSMLMETHKDIPEAPGLWVVKKCRELVRCITSAPRDLKRVEELEKDCEDHPIDVVRYKALETVRVAVDEGKITLPESERSISSRMQDVAGRL